MFLQGCASGNPAAANTAQLPAATGSLARLVPDAKATEPPMLLSSPAQGNPPGILKSQLNRVAELPNLRSPDTARVNLAAALAGKTKAPIVLVYAAPGTTAFFTKYKIDPKTHVQVWERFLRKYGIAFETVATVERLESTMATVVLLPSAVVLSEREMQALTAFRDNGGNILVTWQAGVRDEKGDPRGYGFMEKLLGLSVAGNTEADEDNTFMVAYGDSPLSHSMPAGSRIWLERIKDWYPLQLAGRNSAAQMMDWSRTVAPDKARDTVVYEERALAGGKSSRSVILGFPERLWVSADPVAIQALAHNALSWLLRLPDVYLAAWPHPFGSAFVLAVDIADPVVESDIDIGKLVFDLGGKASYYLLTEHLAKSTDLLKKISAQGHEIGFLSDRFDGFKDQPSTEQAKRFATMLGEMRSSKIDVIGKMGFHAPMDSYDKATEKLLQENSFSHYIGSPNSSEARLPFFAPAITSEQKPGGAIVVLPRTQNGPEELLSEGDPVVGMKTLQADLELAHKMASLSIMRIPGQTLLTKPQMTEISQFLKPKREKIWFAGAGQVTQWWHRRAAISATIDTTSLPPVLTVKVTSDKPLAQPAAVWVNLPEAGSSLRAVSMNGTPKPARTASVDAWRGAIVLDRLPPGEYSWQLSFERAPSRAP